MRYFELPNNSIVWNELLDGPQEIFDQYFGSDKALCILFNQIDIIEPSLSQLNEKLKLSKNINKLRLSIHDIQDPVNIPINVGQVIANILALNKITNLELYRMMDAINIVPIIENLRTNTSLQILHLNCNNISDSGTILLAQSLENNTILEILDLSGNNISALGTAAIAQLLRKNNIISNLNLSHNNIGEGIEPIAEALHHNYNLCELNLADIKINITGIQALANMLTKNNYLIGLNLTGNDIGDDGVNIIAQGLIHNSFLTTLRLTSVNMGDKSLVNLTQVLSHNSRLTCLTLGDNFGDEGIKAMGECLKINSTLNVILISGAIAKDGLESLQEGLKYNSTLIRFDLAGQQIEDRNLVRGIKARCKLNQFNQNINSKTLRDILLEYKK